MAGPGGVRGAGPGGGGGGGGGAGGRRGGGGGGGKKSEDEVKSRTDNAKKAQQNKSR